MKFKSNALFILQLIITAIFVVCRLSVNLTKIQKAKYIYINSDQFGHSVMDSILFIETYGQSSLVLSLGTEFKQKAGLERNRFFDKCLKKNLIGICFPEISTAHGFWRITHPLVRKILRIFMVFLHKDDFEIFENSREFLVVACSSLIANRCEMPIEKAIVVAESLNEKFYAGKTYYYPLGSIPFLLENPSIQTKSLHKSLNWRLHKFVDTRLCDRPIVCLAVRRGDAHWHSKADYYFDVIDEIHSQGFAVTIIGDTQYLINLAKEKNYSLKNKINNYTATNIEQKAFEVFAIQFCEFVVGDQGGVWSLVSAFNKPGLMVNATPTAQLQYNVESLPRKWIHKLTRVEMTDVSIIFGELFYKWKDESIASDSDKKQSFKNFKSEESSQLLSIENDKDFIIKVLKRYMKNSVYKVPNKMEKIVKVNFPENNFLKLAVNSSYSEEYINKLSGWGAE
jgi:hypothetical protein